MNRIALVALLFFSTASTVLAADDEAADAMITRGLELRRQGKGQEALEMFQRADALAPSPRTLGQLGLAESSLEHWTDAAEHLDAALAAPQDPWVHKNHQALELALSIVKRHFGQIALSGPAGATVTIGRKTTVTLPHPEPIPVGEGTANVTASLRGFKTLALKVPVQAGMQQAVPLALDPIEVIPAAPPPAPPPVPVLTPAPAPELQAHRSWRSWTGGALVGAGAGLAAWGIVWIALDGHTSGGPCSGNSPPPGCDAVYNTKTVGWVLTGTGVAMAAVGGVLLYTAHNNTSNVTLGFGPSYLRLGGQF